MQELDTWAYAFEGGDGFVHSEDDDHRDDHLEDDEDITKRNST